MRARKDAELALDFDDLQLSARRPARARDDIRERGAASASSYVLVDEFQDTNGLQCELIDLVAAATPSAFFVGDEFQSIYRFRDADVELFRAAARARAPRRVGVALRDELPLAARAAGGRQRTSSASASTTSYSSRSRRRGGVRRSRGRPSRAVELL